MSFLKISPFIQRIYEGNLVNTARDVQPKAKNFAERIDQLWLRIKAPKMSKEQIQKIPPKTFWWKTGKASSAMGIFGLGVIYHSFQSTDFVVPDNVIPSNDPIQGPDSPITRTRTPSSTLTSENFNPAEISFPVGVGVFAVMAVIAFLGYKFFEHTPKESRQEDDLKKVTSRGKGNVDHQDSSKSEDVPNSRKSVIEQDRPLKIKSEGSKSKERRLSFKTLRTQSFKNLRLSFELPEDKTLPQDSEQDRLLNGDDSEQDNLPKNEDETRFDGIIVVGDYVSEVESAEDVVEKIKHKPKAIDIKGSFDQIREKKLTLEEAAQTRRKLYEDIYKELNSLDAIFFYLPDIDKAERDLIKTELFDFLIESFRKYIKQLTLELNANLDEIPEITDLGKLLSGWNINYNEGTFETFLDNYCRQLTDKENINDYLYKLFTFVKFLDETNQIEDDDSDNEEGIIPVQLKNLRHDSIRKISQSIAKLKNYPQEDRRLRVALATIFVIDAKYLCQSLDDKKETFKSTFEALKIDYGKIMELLKDLPLAKAELLRALFMNALMTNRPQLYDWVLLELKVLKPAAQFKLYEEYLNRMEEKANVDFIEKYLKHLSNQKLFVQLVKDIERCLDKGIVSKKIFELMETGLLRLESKEEISCLNKCLNLCKDNCEMSKFVIEIILRKLRVYVPKDLSKLLPSLKDALSILEKVKPSDKKLRNELQKSIPQLNKAEVTTTDLLVV